MTDNTHCSTPTIRVIAAVIERSDGWLLCKRPVHKRHGGLWEFPGGKLEIGESLASAAKRELDEELGLLVVEVGDCLISIHDPASPYLIEFVQVKTVGDPIAKEHDSIGWFPLEMMAKMNLAPSDSQFASHLRKSYGRSF